MISFVLLMIAVVVHSSNSQHNEVCPGGTFSCPDFATCCILPDSTYGCCAMKNAVCCDDRIHCCPENTRCSAGLCLQLDGLNVTSKKVNSKPTDIHCSDVYTCPDDSTCCKGQDPDTYACCPMLRAVCCRDGKHCCPEGTTCDLQAETCISKDFVSLMYDSNKGKHVPGYTPYTLYAKLKNITNIVCPGSSFQCPDGYTCCKLVDGSWGCCPFVQATCCQDHLHCCPENMKCDNTSQACSKKGQSMPSSLKIQAKKIDLGLVCPDNTTCTDSSTCCLIDHDNFGCCPYNNAVCCPDRSHCCPDGYLCDVEERMCVPGKTIFKHKNMNMNRVNMV